MYDELKAAGAAATSLKAAFELTKAFVDVKGAVEVQGKVFELQRVILAAQQDAFTAQEPQAALLKRIGELEKEIADLEAWDREKERYALTEIASGVFAYKLKPEAQGAEPEHLLCANCFHQHRKSVLQFERRSVGRVEMRVCHACGAELVLHGGREPEHSRPKVVTKKPSPRGWT
jgi:hypothetical protein